MTVYQLGRERRGGGGHKNPLKGLIRHDEAALREQLPELFRGKQRGVNVPERKKRRRFLKKWAMNGQGGSHCTIKYLSVFASISSFYPTTQF